MPDEPDAVCAHCGKSVKETRLGSDVREGEKRFHLDCFLIHKRRAPRERPTSD